MFSKSCEYAIKAMLFLAQKSTNENRIGVKEIAKGIDAPEHFIAKILQDLSKKKLMNSVKGPNGGFYLDSLSLKTSIADIVVAIDGDSIYKNCIIGLKLCSEINPCPVHFEYKEIKKNLISLLEENTLANFNEKMITGKFSLKNS